jgi:hypothetical protein
VRLREAPIRVEQLDFDSGGIQGSDIRDAIPVKIAERGGGRRLAECFRLEGRQFAGGSGHTAERKPFGHICERDSVTTIVVTGGR